MMSNSHTNDVRAGDGRARRWVEKSGGGVGGLEEEKSR